MMTRSAAMKLALVLCLLAVLVSSVRFARLDWTGIPFDRGPIELTKEVSSDCTEHIRPYTTDGGRVIGPISVDEQQYMSMVDHFRGTPADELHISCFIDPFTQRTLVPWLAHLLPFDEGVSIGVVNLAMVLISIWAMVFALRAQRFAARAVAASATLFALGWNTFYFAGVILLDAASLALVSVGWLALVTRRPWVVPMLLLFSYQVKETTAVVLIPVLAAWLFSEYRAGRIGRPRALGVLGASVGAAGASVIVARLFLLQPEATWPLGPSAGAIIHNLFGGPSLMIFVVATGPLFGPAAIVIARRVRTQGVHSLWTDAATVGVLLTVLLWGWVLLAADFSSRFAWVGFPFAASISAIWWSSGRPRELLDRVPIPSWLLAEAHLDPTSVGSRSPTPPRDDPVS